MTGSISKNEYIIESNLQQKINCLTGNININIIRSCNGEVLSHMTALLSYGYLPDITVLASRIPDFNHLYRSRFVYKTQRRKKLNTVYLITK